MDARRSSLGMAIALTMVAATDPHLGDARAFRGVVVLRGPVLAGGALQGFYGVALWLWGGRTVFLLGIGGNLAIVVFYLDHAHGGVPFGPHAGEVEVVGVLDLAATLSEVALVVTLALLLRQGTPVAVREAGFTPGEGGGEAAALSRRDFLRVTGAVGAVGASGAVLGAHVERALGQEAHHQGGHAPGAGHDSHGGNGVVGDVDLSRFDPTRVLEGLLLGRGAQGGREDRQGVRANGGGDRDRGRSRRRVSGLGLQRAGSRSHPEGHGG